MEYEEIGLLKQSEKSTVLLMRETGGEQVFVQKILKGRHEVYTELLNCPHLYLPKIYDVAITEEATTIIEEYIDGQSLRSSELSEKQLLGAVRELCSVLEFLHDNCIIHRDIKPSNIILAKDGHISASLTLTRRGWAKTLWNRSRIQGCWAHGDMLRRSIMVLRRRIPVPISIR